MSKESYFAAQPFADKKYCSYSRRDAAEFMKNSTDRDFVYRMFDPVLDENQKLTPKSYKMHGNILGDTFVSLNFMVFKIAGTFFQGFCIMNKLIILTSPFVDIYFDSKLHDINAQIYIDEPLLVLSDPYEIDELIKKISMQIVQWNSLIPVEMDHINFNHVFMRNIGIDTVRHEFMYSISDCIAYKIHMPLKMYGKISSGALCTFLRDLVTNIDDCIEYNDSNVLLCLKPGSLKPILKFLEENSWLEEFEALYKQLIVMSNILEAKHEPCNFCNLDYLSHYYNFPEYQLFIKKEGLGACTTESFETVC